MPRRLPVSDAELEVLKVLWEKGDATVREVDAQLRRRKRRLAYNTVLTLLSRLRDKGYVSVDRRTAAHVFHSIVSREELLSDGLTTLAARVCDGTASPLVHALVTGQKFTSDDIVAFRKLLDDLSTGE